MAKRINISIRNLSTNEVQTQAVNQEGVDILDLAERVTSAEEPKAIARAKENFDKHAKRLIERTVHRFYGPNGAMVMTSTKVKGKNAGYEGVVGHKANWGGEDRPRLFNKAQRVLVTFAQEDGTPILPVIVDDETSDSAAAE